MIKTTLLSAAAGLAFLSAAAGAPPAPAPRFPINGAGSATCAVWNAKAKGAASNQSDQTTRMIQASWAQGYLTALNSVAVANGGADWLDGVQFSEIVAGIDAHCAANPADQIVTAVLAVSKTLATMAAIRGKH
jgi:hypothetical protein